MFMPFSTSLEAPEGLPVKTKKKSDTKLLKFAVRSLIRGPTCHLAAVPGGGRHRRRPVDRASDC